MKVMEKLSSLFGVQDMTTGKPMDTLIAFSIPLLIGNFAQQLYNTVDSIIVGQYIGDTALAAVGTSGPILNLMLVLFMGISTGASILSAQFFGAKDKKTLSRLVGSTFFLILASGIFMSVLGFVSTRFLVSLVRPPENVSAGAVIYLQIIFIGMTGAAAYNILSGVLRGMGDSVYPLIFLVVSCITNIVLDIVFVKNLGWGIAGVAWATIIAQGISGVLCTIRLLRMKDQLDLSRSVFIPDKVLMYMISPSSQCRVCHRPQHHAYHRHRQICPQLQGDRQLGRLRSQPEGILHQACDVAVRSSVRGKTRGHHREETARRRTGHPAGGAHCRHEQHLSVAEVHGWQDLGRCRRRHAGQIHSRDRGSTVPLCRHR